MDRNFLTGQLVDNAARIRAICSGVNTDQARWRPDAQSWSMLEVLNHLYDEEREDFRVRLNLILTDPTKPWPPIDPEGWVSQRRYNEREFEGSLNAFLTERDRSIEWLHSLGDPNWDTTCRTPFGVMRAGDMFASWVTHDHLHLRQLVELHRQLTAEMAKPYRLDYAGPW